MAKVFNVEQLRINGRLLTGNGNELFYDGIQLAQGEQAVPTDRTLTAGVALEWAGESNDTQDLSADRTMNVLIDGATIRSNASDETLYVNEISFGQLSTLVAGAGIGGGDSQALFVGAGTGIHVEGNNVNIDVSGVNTTQLYDASVTNAKLATISAAGKIQGSAVQLGDSTIEDDNGLQVAVNSIGKEHLKTNVAGAGLAGGGSNSTALSVGAGSGIIVNADDVNIGPLGVVSTMINNLAVGNAQLNTISATDKVYGGAIKLNGDTLGVEGNGLLVNDSGIGFLQLHTDIAGAGLAGGYTAALSVNGGSGIVVAEDDVNIGPGGVVKSMMAASSVGSSNIDSNEKIAMAKTELTAGDGLDLSTNTLSVNVGDGMEIYADSIEVTSNVVRATGVQTLAGEYTFSEDVLVNANLTVTGNLEVRGDTILTESNQVNIGDSIIVLNDDYPVAGTTPPNAGIEIERGAADGGSDGSQNAKLLFDDDRTVNAGADTWVAGKGSNLFQIHTTDFSRSFSAEVASGVTTHALNWSADHTFAANPQVVVSLEHTGQYGVSNPDLLGAMVTELHTTGVHVDFTAALPASGYHLNVYASTI